MIKIRVSSSLSLIMGFLSFMVFIITLLAAFLVYAQAPSTGGQVSIPESSIEKPGDSGVGVHTNIQIYHPNRSAHDGRASPSGGGPGVAHSRPPLPGTEGGSGAARPQ